MKAPEQWILTQIGGGQNPKDIGKPSGSVITIQTERKRLKSQPQYKQFTLVVRRKVAFEKCPVMKKCLSTI